MDGSGPTFAGGERSEPPCKSAGRGPGETMPLDKLTVEAESASASPKLRAVGQAAMPAPRQPGPLVCTPQDGLAAAPGPVVRRRSPLGGAGGGRARRPLRSPAEPERPSPLGIPL
jgi:hypothetical protein